MALRDIRDLKGEEYAEELNRRWGGLLSYRYLAASAVSGQGTVIRHDMRNDTGGLMIAPIAITAPESGGMIDTEDVPSLTIHSCQIFDPGRDVKRIITKSEVLRRGRQMGYSRSLILDADNPDRVVALTEGQAASIGKPPEGLSMHAEPLEIEDSPDLPPLWQVFGGSKRDDGHWTLKELEVEWGSPDGALHIGPQHVILETAALDYAAEAAGTDRLQGVSSHVMFLARGKVGPFRVEGHPVKGTDGFVGARVVLHDEGVDDRPVTSGSYMFRPAD